MTIEEVLKKINQLEWQSQQLRQLISYWEETNEGSWLNEDFINLIHHFLSEQQSQIDHQIKWIKSIEINKGIIERKNLA